MSKIYSAPKHIRRPEYGGDFKAYEKEQERYVNEIKAFIKLQGDGSPESGKEIRFPVADGYACYLVLSIKPLTLIHLDIGDGYSFQYANRLTVKDVKDQVRALEAMNKLFSKKKESVHA